MDRGQLLAQPAHLVRQLVAGPGHLLEGSLLGQLGLLLLERTDLVSQCQDVVLQVRGPLVALVLLGLEDSPGSHDGRQLCLQILQTLLQSLVRRHGLLCRLFSGLFGITGGGGLPFGQFRRLFGGLLGLGGLRCTRGLTLDEGVELFLHRAQLLDLLFELILAG